MTSCLANRLHFTNFTSLWTNCKVHIVWIYFPQRKCFGLKPQKLRQVICTISIYGRLPPIFLLFIFYSSYRSTGWLEFIYIFIFLVKFTLAAFSLNCRTLLLLIFMRSKSSQKITHKLRTPYTVDPTFDQSNQNTR